MERDRYLSSRSQHPQNSIPPADTLEIPVAETNYSPQIYSWEEFIKQESEQQAWIIDGILYSKTRWPLKRYENISVLQV